MVNFLSSAKVYSDNFLLVLLLLLWTERFTWHLVHYSTISACLTCFLFVASVLLTPDYLHAVEEYLVPFSAQGHTASDISVVKVLCVSSPK
jgi:hypothetical protein